MNVSSSVKTLLVVVAVVAMIVTVPIVAYVSANNYGVDAESGLEAARKNAEVVLSRHEQTALEMAQVPAMYADQFKQIVRETMQGRYGPNGSGAVFQWIQERNMNFDANLYRDLNQAIKSGRLDFEDSQKVMVDRQRAYKRQLGTVWRGFWLRQAGFPTINLADFDPVITNRTADAFATKREAGPIKLQ